MNCNVRDQSLDVDALPLSLLEVRQGVDEVGHRDFDQLLVLLRDVIENTERGRPG